MTQNEKFEDCLILMQSILSNSCFEVETSSESALVKAMEIAGFPVDVDKHNLDTDFHYKTNKTFITKLIEAKENKNKKIEKLKQLLLLTDDAVSHITVNKTQLAQWKEYTKVFPDEVN